MTGILFCSLQGIFQNFKYDIFITILSMEFAFIAVNLSILFLFIISAQFTFISLFLLLIALSSAESAILVTLLLQITSSIKD